MKNKEIIITKKNYSNNVKQEWTRLVKDPYHELEFSTTLYFLKKYLPKRGLILDAGGGPGRYTIELAKLGYDIVLLDLVEENLEFARKQIKKSKVEGKVKQIIQGSITDLSEFSNNTFDAVICLGGPLSHNTEEQRQKAVSELVRVSKKNSNIFTSVMGKYAVLLNTPSGWPEEVELKNFYNIIENGDDYRWRGTGYCHFFTSSELEDIFLREKVKIIDKVGLEGLNIDGKVINKFARNFPKAWKNWLDIHIKICTESFVVDSSSHILIITKKL